MKTKQEKNLKAGRAVTERVRTGKKSDENILSIYLKEEKKGSQSGLNGHFNI